MNTDFNALTVAISGTTVESRFIDRLRAEGIEVLEISGDLAGDELVDSLNRCDVHLLAGDEQITKDVIEKIGNRPKLIAFLGTGYSSFIDANAAADRGIAITSTPGAMAHSVAEQTLGHILNARRDLDSQDAAVKSGGWYVEKTTELHGARVGLIGMGVIGQQILRLLNAFGCETTYWSRSRKLDLERNGAVSYLELDDVLSKNEIVVLMLPTNNETTAFFDEEKIRRMRPGSILINTAGARLVDPHALRSALDDGHLRRASFDGYYVEPIPPNFDDPFGLLNRTDRGFFITPHSAALTHTARDRMAEMAISSILNFVKTGTDKYLV